MTYQEKLQLPEWQKKRIEILERDNYSCKKCGFNNSKKNPLFTLDLEEFITNYKIQILIESDNYKFIEQKEIEFIALYGRRNLGKGTLVNLTDGGEARRNVIVSEETRKKISKSSIGRLSPNKGKRWSQEFKNKISNSLKGNKLSKKSIEKRTNTLKQKAIERGFYQHEKWKQNIGKSNSKIVYAIINNNFYEFESCHKAEKILNISFQSIETFGDGSVGIQISKPIGTLTVHGNVTTHGSIGSSLVKGVYFDLPAYALSIKNGGEAKSITINGNVQTFGDNVISYIVEQGGNPGTLTIGGQISANGKNAQKEKIE